MGIIPEPEFECVVLHPGFGGGCGGLYGEGIGGNCAYEGCCHCDVGRKRVMDKGIFVLDCFPDYSAVFYLGMSMRQVSVCSTGYEEKKGDCGDYIAYVFHCCFIFQRGVLFP